MHHQLLARTHLIVLGLVTAWPLLLVLVATRRGPGISPDSVAYASAARSFAAVGHLVTYSGRPLTIFPPGLPLLLGIAVKAGVDIQVADVTLNVLCVAAVVLGTYLLAREVLSSPRLSLLAAAVVALSASTVEVFSWLWTEPLFTALALYVLWVLVRATRGDGLTPLGLTAVVLGTSIATTVRYFGVVLIPVVMVGTLLAEQNRGRRAALVRSLLVGLGASLGLLVVAVRNFTLGVGPLGDRNPANASVRSVAHQTLRTLGAYMVPNHLSGLSQLVGAGLALLLCYGTWRVIRRHDSAMLLLTAFIAVYWLILWYSELTTLTDRVDERLCAPILAPMVILVIYAVRDAAQKVNDRRLSPRAQAGRPFLSYTVTTGIALTLLLVLVVSPLEGAKSSRAGAIGGIGYNSDAARASSLAQALKTLPGNAWVAADDPWAVYWVSHRDPALPIPSRYYYLPQSETLHSLKGAVAARSVIYLAYFRNSKSAMQPDSLAKAGIDSVLVGSFSDGTLYRVTSR